MRCNACWRELEGQAITSTCGHLFCQDDASKILSNDAACPICDQVLSKSLMKPVDVSPSDEWTNMAMAGISPQILMKSAYRSVTFYIGQKELEMQFKMNRIVAQCRQKCEMMQEKFSEKLEQVHTAYQKMGKRCQMMEQEIESLSKDKQELQEKFAEKSRFYLLPTPQKQRNLMELQKCALIIHYNLLNFWGICKSTLCFSTRICYQLYLISELILLLIRQKRKLDEMYDQLRDEYESVKRSAIQPKNFFSRTEPDLFANNANMMDNRVHMGKGPREDIWPPPRQNGSNSGPFDISSGSPARQSAIPVDAGNRRTGASSMLGVGTGAGNPTKTLRNLIFSPIKRPQVSRNRPQMFAL
ncbi:E3 ubiquitin-protein ligase CCNB1IP1 homolog isoform X2 [Lycium ferocissimum]|uniref:E3 ubiquitin-protein ligase CCNB1IP1 homolog isoform X2 n=1 Tax=Lycium ferocissimum TaxID=112874 RepID=UPI0028160255|nr:E3 ubiquitin-protein ligase CCNB1IP1 homolog isoform X2 [Lycium ferocissimum]